MSNVMFVEGFSTLDLDGSVAKLVVPFVQKLMAFNGGKGLNVEQLKDVADRRIRSARVNQQYRALLFELAAGNGGTLYVVAGIYNHDDAYQRARTLVLKTNPITGIPNVTDLASAKLPAVASQSASPRAKSYLRDIGYAVTDLTDVFGFAAELAATAFRARSEEELVALAASLDDRLAQDVLVGMGSGMSVDSIRVEVGLDTPIAPAVDESDLTDAEMVERLQHPTSRFRFTTVADVDDLRAVIEGGDLAAWRVFLHPEQRRYVDVNTSGPFRLTGGAGTGKTVVLLHRARRLAKSNPDARIVLTTYTKGLAALLRRDLRTLDSSVRIAERLGEAGVLIENVDRLASMVRSAARTSGFAAASKDVLEMAVDTARPSGGTEAIWRSAVAASPDLPRELATPSFLEAEYEQVVLPTRATSKTDYFAARRAGRGVALDRAKRAALWQVIAAYRSASRKEVVMTFAEIAETSAVWLERQPTRPADHVIVDEGQDLGPSHWHLLRAMVAPGANDMFIAEDAFQRIYGHHLVLKHLGVNIVGRSRRLTLNYRTTFQNLQVAIGVVRGIEFAGSEDDQDERIAGYRSARVGPEPVWLGFDAAAEHDAAVGTLIRSWLDDGVDPGSIGILVHGGLPRVRDRLAGVGVSVGVASDGETSGIPVVRTMHGAKGLEFGRVIVWDVSAETMPSAQARVRAAAAGDNDELLRERSLLYVALSRARDELAVTWVGEPSPFLHRTGSEAS